MAIPRVFTHDGRAEQLLCMVCRTPGHERPAVRRNGLCESCDQARKAAGQTAEGYAADAVPRPSFGRCLRCERWAARRRSRLCSPAMRAGESGAARTLRSSRQAGYGERARRAGSRSIYRRCLNERGLRSFMPFRSSGWTATMPGWARVACSVWSTQSCMRARARCLRSWHSAATGRGICTVSYRGPVERLLADPERELSLDVWRMGLLRPDGGRKVIDYRVVTQPWLRELVKQWNRERLVSHSFHTLRASVQFAAALSAVLALRVDRGEDPSALGRQDVVDFLTRPVRARAGRRDLTCPPGRMHLMAADVAA